MCTTKEIYKIEGWDCIAPRLGTEFKVRVFNTNDYVALGTLAVDGEDVQEGIVAIIHPKQSYTFAGWRKDTTNVKKFVFSESVKDIGVANSNSTAVKTSDAAVGLISCTFYRGVPAGEVDVASLSFESKGLEKKRVYQDNQKKKMT